MSNKAINQYNFNIKISAILAMFIFSLLFFTQQASAVDYRSQGTFVSTNFLASSTDVELITDFNATTTIFASTSVSAQFSKNGAVWWSSDGTRCGWDSLSDGANNIDLSALNWSGSYFYYKFKLETTDSSTTPIVSQVDVEYSDDHDMDTEYCKEGALISVNLLSGKTDVSLITQFSVVADIPASTTVQVQFSRNGVTWRDKSDTFWEWENLSDGTNDIDLTALNWEDAYFFYKLRFTSENSTTTASVTSVEIQYSDTGGGGITEYNTQGTILSTDLLDGLSGDFTIQKFGYNITSLPASTTIQVQFGTSTDEWYNSSGAKWELDTLSSGDHLAYGDAIDLSALNITGADSSFYYKIKFETEISTSSPILSDVQLYYIAIPVVSTASSTLIASQVATANGDIISIGGLAVTARGFKYGLTETDTWTVSESSSYGVNAFKLLTENLSSGTVYYIRAYATNSDGSGYGDYISFTTLSESKGSPIIFKKNVILKENVILK